MSQEPRCGVGSCGKIAVACLNPSDGAGSFMACEDHCVITVSEATTVVATKKVEFIKTLINCARCKGTHTNIVWIPLIYPVTREEDEKILYSHWAPCPINGQPILMVIE